MKPSRERGVRKLHRERLKEAGLCVKECGKPAAVGGFACEECAEKARGFAKDRKTRLINQGLCGVCGKQPVVQTKTRCRDCIQSVLRRHELALCSKGCGRPAADGKRSCTECLIEQRQKDDRQKEANLCITYCGAPAVAGKQKCERCLLKTVLRNSQYYARNGGYAPISASFEQLEVWYLDKIKTCAGSCEWCLEPFNGRPIIDHDHETGELRALLCVQCNSAEGLGISRLQRVLAKMHQWNEQKLRQSASTSSTSSQ